MKSIECVICCHDERSLIERMLSKGESVSYLLERFKGVNETTIRAHRDLHMEPARSVDFASPQNILWDLQETRNQLKGLIDWALEKENMRPGVALQAIGSLIVTLESMRKKANEVRRIEVGMDGEALKRVILEVLEDDPERLEKFRDTLQRRMLEIEEQ